MTATRAVHLPEELCRAAEKKFARRFDSVDELVAELLKQLVSDSALAMDEDEQKIVEERLKGLGYI